MLRSFESCLPEFSIIVDCSVRIYSCLLYFSILMLLTVLLEYVNATDCSIRVMLYNVLYVAVILT